MDRFIQADGRLNLFLKFGMVDDVFVMQRLLEHHHVVLVHLLEQIHVSQGICGVGIAHQLDVRERGPYLADHFNVPARLDFDFDPPVPRLHFGIDFGQQLVDRRLNANRDAAVNALSRSSKQLPKRNVLDPGFEIPERRFQSGFRHVVAADFTSFPAKKAGNDEIAKDMPRGFRCLVAVEGTFACGYFSPAGVCAIRYFEQKDAPLLGDTEARLERVQEPHVQLAHFNLFNEHATLPG